MKTSAERRLTFVVVMVASFSMLVGTTAHADLYAFYPFNQDDPLADASGNGRTLNTVAPNESPTYNAGAGFQGGAYAYDGNDRLIAPFDINPPVIPELTLGAWVRTDELNPGLYKVLGHDSGAWDRVIGLDNREGAFRYTAFTGTNNNGPVDGTPGPVNTTDWTFLAVTYSQPTNTVSVYVDIDAGTTGDPLVVRSEPSAMGPGLTTTAIGGLRPDNTAEGWRGGIDNVFFYDEILSGEQLTAIRNGGAFAIIIPEPSSLILMTMGMFGLGVLGRRRRKT